MADDFLEERARLVASVEARMVSFDVIPMGASRMRQIALFYPFSDKKKAEEASRYLGLCTSTINGLTKRQWVNNPLGNRQEYAGLYRQISLKLTEHNNSPGVMQVLREGFVQSLTPTEVEDDEARLVSVIRDPVTGLLTLTRKWTNIDPEYLQFIEDSKRSVITVINPQCEVLDYESDPLIGQKSYPGTFSVQKRQGQPVDGDICCEIYESLQQVNVVGSLADLTALTPEILTQENEVRDIFSTATGDADSIALRYRGLSRGSRAYCMGEAASNLQGLVASGDAPAWVTGTEYKVGHRIINTTTRYICLVDHTAGTFSTDLTTNEYWLALVTWTYADRKFEEPADGTGSFTLLLRRERWNTGVTDSDALIIAQTAGLDRQQKSLTRVWLRRTLAAKNSLTTGSGAAISAYTYLTVPYLHDSFSVSEVDGGGFNVTQRLAVSRNTITIHDRETDGLVLAYEDIFPTDPTGSFMYQRCLVEEYRMTTSSLSAAYAYAGVSSLMWSHENSPTPTRSSKGYVRYIGNDKYEAHKFIITPFSNQSAQSWS